jgi:hypothetical protein
MSPQKKPQADLLRRARRYQIGEIHQRTKLIIGSVVLALVMTLGGGKYKYKYDGAYAR